MRNNIRYLLIAATIVLLSNFVLPSGSARRPSITPATIDRSSANRNSSHIAWFSVANFLQGDGFDIRVAKSVNSDTVAPGEDLTFTINVANDGPDPSDTATLNDPLPAYTTFVSLLASGTWSCSTPPVGSGGLVSCTNPTLAPGSDDTFTLVVHVDPMTPTNTFITNTATVSTAAPDNNDENNSASATSLVPGTNADIGVTKSADADTVFAGSNITYTVVVSNGGPDPGVSATFSDPLPVNMTFVSLASPPGWSCAPLTPGMGGTVSCTNPSFAVTAGETFTIVGNVPPETPNGTTYQNVATVSSTTQDPNSINDQAPASTTVVSCFLGPVVTTNVDSGPGSLRQAIADACADGTIFFDPNLVSPITLTSSELIIDKNLTIQGPGANLLTVQRSTAGGTPDFRIFKINSDQTATISGLTISNGKATGANPNDRGGAILNDHGTLTIDACSVSGNSATVTGGIYNDGTTSGTATLTINNSTVSNNTATSVNGGIFNQGTSGSAILTMTNSTVSGNDGDAGGGLMAEAGGAGSSTVTLTNVTITDNIRGVGGGMFLVDSPGNIVRLNNTIVAGNFASTGGAASDIQGTVDAANSFNNLIGTGGSGTLVHGTNGNQVNVADVRLGPLAFNGGPTRTHALLSGSPALDAGSDTLSDAAGLTTDQRGAGFDRKRDAASDADTTQTVDIGAFEVDPSVEDISDKVTQENTPIAFSFNVGDSATSFDSITATSNNIMLVPNANMQITGSGSTRTLTITPAAGQSGDATITVTATKTIGGTPVTGTDAFLLTVIPNNSPPVNTVPGPQSMNENGTLTFSAANGNQISIADDAGTNPVRVNLTSTNGRMTLSGTAGLTFIPPDPTNDGTADVVLNFSGTIANINAALNGMVFTAAPGYDGPAVIQIVTNDQGNTGAGGPLSDTDSINITVADGGTLAFSSATYNVAENGANATITVNRSGGTSGEARVSYATSNGTADSAQDYTTTSGQLIFANGVTTQTFNVPITSDTLDEASETVNLTLSNAIGTGALGSPINAVLTITDDDSTPSLSINDMTLNEGNAGTTNFVFTVTLSAASGQNVTVNYQTANGSATSPSDYQALPNTLLTFTAGETSKTVTVLVNGDTAAEITENFFVNLSGATNATISDGQGVGTIVNDDTPVIQFASANQSVNEGAGHIAVTVTRSGDPSVPVRVDYASTDLSGLNNCSQVTGNASQRCDYATVVGALRFASGESSKDIIIPIIDDVHIEGNEIFTLVLFDAVDGVLGLTNTSTITIVDNDTAPAPNPIFNDAFFIRELYIDLLGRLPEPGAVNNWLAILNNCPVPTDPVNGCDRIAVAAGFLRSAEFQGRGYFVYRHYSAALGRIPLYSEFIPDMAFLNGFLSTTDLEANKIAYTDAVMNRPEFKAIYDPTLGNPTAYVDKLLEKSNLPSHPGRAGWIAGLTNSTLTRAQVLRQFIDSTEVYTKYVNEAFIIMNYFGFLRRSADAAYQAWFDIFNNTNDYRLIINGFMNSAEYRLRFGP